jgi:subtilisin family serine protease
MHRLCLLLFALIPLLSAGRVPGRYIVELSTESVAEHAVPRRDNLRGPSAQSHRALVRSEQQKLRGRLSQLATVTGSVDTVANAIFVEKQDDDPSALRSLPGVRKVYPVRTFRMVLDHAVGVHRVTSAWNELGLDRSGAGIKIAIIDSGIESTHPGFSDSSLPSLEGFPKVADESDRVFTNSKIIVARSYVGLLPSRDPDRSARDRVGHGTALAMIAAGVTNGSITGVAPKAYLGNYKVFGTPGFSDSTTDEAILKAIDDAVSDGMDVINLSLGDDFAPRIEDDLEVQAIERAVRAGVIVVVAAGNNGPGAATVASPATAPSAIAVGASRNDRTFAASVELPGILTAVAVPGSGVAPSGPIEGTVVDVSAFEGSGQACGNLPTGAMIDRVALILRGECTFEQKLLNAQQAGAKAAIVYAAASAPHPFVMGAGTAGLPAEMVSYADGIAIKHAAASSEVQAILRFTVGPVAVNPSQLASFSAAGPGVDQSVKPDLVAVGNDMYTAAQTYDRNGDMYSATGYITVGGTSFSCPFTAGVAALIKSARPGLTVEQYRSLIINTAAPLIGTRIQQSGSGLLDALSALRSTVTASPTTLNFGSGTADPDTSRMLRISNAGTTEEIFTIAADGAGAAPSTATGTVTLAPGASQDVAFDFRASGLEAGAHEGFIRIIGNASGTEVRVPFWYAVRTGAPASFTIISTTTSGRRGGMLRDAVYFKVLDAAGLPLLNVPLDAEATAGDGAVVSFTSYDPEVPGLYAVTLRLGLTAGTNQFRLHAGDAYVDVNITGR